MADEKTFTIPLRKEFIKSPSYKKTKKAVNTVRNYLKRHMKSEEIKIGKHLNLKLWEHGRKNPPPKIKIKAIKEDNIVRVELPEFEFERPKKEEKKKSTVDALKEKLTGKEESKKDLSLVQHQKKEKKEIREKRKEKLKPKKEEKPKEESKIKIKEPTKEEKK